MPRVYVKKRQTKYSLADLQKAVRDVEDKKKTYRQAEEAYNVPVSVIYHRIKGRKININQMGAGVSKVLPDRVEEHITSCLKTRAQMGYPVMKEELKNLVKVYVEENAIANPFKDNKPGDDWYISFMKRHPELSFKKPEHLQKARMDARKPYIIYDFYDQLKSTVHQNGLDDKPMYVYNCDESGFQSDPSKLRAIGQKGKPLYRVSGGSGRESTTVLACVSADSQVLPPVIVFKGAAVQARWTSEKALPGTLYAATKNGWMEEPVFFNWLIKSFIPHVSRLREERKEPEQKALLLYDGHASHISVRIIEEADKANIILMKFPSHLTDKIQPLDKCVFGPVKKTWEKRLVEYGIQQMGKGSGRLSREHFGELLGEVYTISFKPKNVISGFTTTGLHPVDPSKFPKSLFKPDNLKLYTVLLNNDQNGKNIEDDVALWQQEAEQLYLERSQRDNLADESLQMELSDTEIQQVQFEEIDRQQKHGEIQQLETDEVEIQQMEIEKADQQDEQIQTQTTEIHNATKTTKQKRDLENAEKSKESASYKLANSKEAKDTITEIQIKDEPDCDNSSIEEEERSIAEMLQAEMNVKAEPDDDMDIEEDSLIYSPLACELCAEVFTVPGAWVRHVEGHAIDTPHARKRKSRSASDDTEETMALLRCDLCQKHFPNPGEWVRHIQSTHTETEKSKESVSYKPANSKEAKDTTTEIQIKYEPDWDNSSIEEEERSIAEMLQAEMNVKAEPDDDMDIKEDSLVSRGRPRRTPYMNAMVDANRRANEKKCEQGESGAGSSGLPPGLPRKQSYSLFLKQRAVLFSAKKWKQ